jgi:F-type H+-transporting ATPase subunit gamma
VPAFRDIVRRIDSIRNTQKITKAMQVVAATRLRRAQAAVQATRPYSEKMLEVLQTTAERATEYKHPFLVRREGKRAVMILVTTDKGLCGAINVNNIRAATRYMNEHHTEGQRYVTIGRKGRDFLLRYRREVIAEGKAGPSADYIYEPDPESVLDGLLPRYVETQVFQAVLENKASEYSAKMIAMQNATNAAGDLIDALTLYANKVRQAGITTELMEIVSGAEAMRASS